MLTTPVGCIPEVVKDSDTGFLMEDNTPECIARNVIRALNHPHIKEIADNGRKLIEERYTYKAAVERYGIILHDAWK